MAQSNHLFPDVLRSPRTAPGFPPRPLPMDFVDDDGNVHKKEGKAHGGNLLPPGFEALFTPGGGLDVLSVAHTPRGTYGVGGAPGDATPGGGGSGPLPPAPAFLAALSGLEEGGHAGVDTPKMPPNGPCGATRVSPLAAKEFGEVFADTPRWLAPASSGRNGGAPAASFRALAGPVPGAPHAAVQDFDLDNDLNALMQIGENASVNDLFPMMADHADDSWRLTIHGEMMRKGAPPSVPPRKKAGASAVKSSLKKKPKKRRSAAKTTIAGPRNLKSSHKNKAPSSARSNTVKAIQADMLEPWNNVDRLLLHVQHDNPSTTSPSVVQGTVLELKEVSPPIKSPPKTKSSHKNKAPSPARSDTKATTKADDPANRGRPPTVPHRASKRAWTPSPKASRAPPPKRARDFSAPADAARIAAAIRAAAAAYGDGAEREEKLAAVEIRGVTERHSKNWVRRPLARRASGVARFGETLGAHLLLPCVSSDVAASASVLRRKIAVPGHLPIQGASLPGLRDRAGGAPGGPLPGRPGEEGRHRAQRRPGEGGGQGGRGRALLPLAVRRPTRRRRGGSPGEVAVGRHTGVDRDRGPGHGDGDGFGISYTR